MSRWVSLKPRIMSHVGSWWGTCKGWNEFCGVVQKNLIAIKMSSGQSETLLLIASIIIFGCQYPKHATWGKYTGSIKNIPIKCRHHSNLKSADKARTEHCTQTGTLTNWKPHNCFVTNQCPWSISCKSLDQNWLTLQLIALLHSNWPQKHNFYH